VSNPTAIDWTYVGPYSFIAAACPEPSSVLAGSSDEISEMLYI